MQDGLVFEKLSEGFRQTCQFVIRKKSVVVLAAEKKQEFQQKNLSDVEEFCDFSENVRRFRQKYHFVSEKVRRT